MRRTCCYRDCEEGAWERKPTKRKQRWETDADKISEQRGIAGIPAIIPKNPRERMCTSSSSWKLPYLLFDAHSIVCRNWSREATRGHDRCGTINCTGTDQHGKWLAGEPLEVHNSSKNESKAIPWWPQRRAISAVLIPPMFSSWTSIVQFSIEPRRWRDSETNFVSMQLM